MVKYSISFYDTQSKNPFLTGQSPCFRLKRTSGVTSKVLHNVTIGLGASIQSAYAAARRVLFGSTVCMAYQNETRLAGSVHMPSPGRMS